MATYYKQGKNYTVSYRLKGCRREYIYGLRSEAIAKRAKEKKDLEEDLSRAGLYVPDPEAAQLSAAQEKHICVHVAAFEQHLIAEGRVVRHARQQALHVRRLMTIAAIQGVGEIALEPVQRALKEMLGLTHGPTTCNHARQAAIQFERWLRKTKKVRHTVLQDLKPFNEQVDVRRKRRALSQEEVDWLLRTTCARRDVRGRPCGVSPADRAMLYAVGIATGFRRSALLSLEKSAFLVAPGVARPVVRLAAKSNKKRKPRDQRISRAFAAKLHAWLRSKPDYGPVWRPFPHADLALRFRRDMERARAAWIAAAPNAPVRRRREATNILKYVYDDGSCNVFADFHGLRHTGITFVARKAGLRAAQALGRPFHASSDISLRALGRRGFGESR